MQKLIMTMLLAGVFAATSIQASHAAGVGGAGEGVGAGQAGGSMTIGNSGSGVTTGMGNGGLSNEAGSIAAGANSALNPSGNTFIEPPPGEAFDAGRIPGARR